jgi:hypothetical protein
LFTQTKHNTKTNIYTHTEESKNAAAVEAFYNKFRMNSSYLGRLDPATTSGKGKGTMTQHFLIAFLKNRKRGQLKGQCHKIMVERKVLEY